MPIESTPRFHEGEVTPDTAKYKNGRLPRIGDWVVDTRDGKKHQILTLNTKGAHHIHHEHNLHVDDYKKLSAQS